MKIKIICKSLLLDKALKNFLQDYISYDDYDILISDKTINDKTMSKKLFLIDKDIKKPFSKENLFDSLQKFKQKNIKENEITHIEEEIQSLLKEYTIKINKLAKKKYEYKI